MLPIDKQRLTPLDRLAFFAWLCKTLADFHRTASQNADHRRPWIPLRKDSPRQNRLLVWN